MIERRSVSRWPLSWEAKFKIKNKKGPFASCCVNDISLKGLQLATKERLPKERFLNLVIMLSHARGQTPDTQARGLTLDTRFEIMWQKADKEKMNTYGLRFADIREREKEMIYRFIYDNLSKEVAEKWWEGTR